MIKILVLAILLSCFSARSIESEYLSSLTFLPQEKIEGYFGKKDFNEIEFKKGTRKHRGEMARTLISSKKFIGLTAGDVKTRLGRFDGSFWNDTVPAYLIDGKNMNKGDQWQIVFLLDEKGLISEVRVHKNCCK